MKKISLFLLLPLAFLFLGCANEHAGHHEGEAVAVKLDNGNKWVANPETTEGIVNMQSLVDAYLGGGDTDVQALRTSLETEFSTIFEKCTMKGEAHEQLHNYLLPIKAMLKNLDENAGTAEIESIRAYLGTYKNSFMK